MSQPIPGALQYEVGRSNSDSRAFFGGMPLDAGRINPDYISFLDDFDLLHGKAFNATDMWSVVKDASASVAVSSSLGGVVILSSAATTDNDGAAIMQSIATVARQSGKKLWFEAQVQVSDIDSDLFVGLSEVISTNPEDVWLDATHRIGISVRSDNDGGTGLLIADQSNGTISQTMSLGANMVAATYKKLGFYYDGTSISFFVDRVLKLSGVVPAPASATDLMGVCVSHLSGNNAGTDTLSCDYVMVVAER